MKRLPHVVIMLVAVALVAADEGKKKKKGDAEAIQGKWTIVEAFVDGEKDDEPVGDVVTFAGKKMIVAAAKGKDRKIEFTFAVRPDKKPKHFDMTMKLGDEKKTMEGIYELSGDTLKICVKEPGTGRPKKIAAEAGDKRMLLVLKRVKGGSVGDQR